MSIHITPNENGGFNVRVFATHLDEFGKRKSKFKSNIKTVTRAKVIAHELQELLDREIDEDMTFAELNEIYAKSRENKMSPITLDRNKYICEPLLKYFGKVKIRDINNRLAQQYVDKRQNTISKSTQKRLSKGTIKREFSYLRAVLNWAVANDYLEHNRIVRVEYAEDEEEFEPTILSAETIKNVLVKLKKDYYNLYIPILLCITTGLRRGEALGLKWNCVDFENCCIHIRNSLNFASGKIVEKNTLKTLSSKRILFIPNFLKNELYFHKGINAVNEEGFVCANVFEGSAPISPDNLTHKFHLFMKTGFGIDIRLHDLRHSLNQMMYEAGIVNTTRAQVLGHSSTKMTDKVYTHTSSKLIQEALESVNEQIESKL